MSAFSLVAQDPKSRARAGLLRTPHGDIETPAFMPVATQGSVKALSQEDLDSLGVKAILSNSYHLYLRPGPALISKAGGLHRFMGYSGMILTDSGGFQVWSQSDLRKISDEGVFFKSHIDGSGHLMTPAKVIEIQSSLGSDCWTTLDECAPYPCPEDQAQSALERTMRWTEDSLPPLARAREGGQTPLFFPILQGSFYPALRRRAAEHLARVPHDGVALGGFSVGEPKELSWQTLEQTISGLAEDKPRYLMGVGTPEDLWQASALGVDMLDCVFPTRVARNGLALTRSGRLNIGNAAHKDSPEPLDSACPCFVCRRYSRAYLRHLFVSKELAVYRYLTYHNLRLMLDSAREIRRAIVEGRFSQAWAGEKARGCPEVPEPS